MFVDDLFLREIPLQGSSPHAVARGVPRTVGILCRALVGKE